MTDFQKFTMTSPGKLAKYVGFTEEEVKKICKKYHMDFDNMQTWYDGYSFSRIQHIYSPNSVMLAIRNEEFQNYWTASETYESLKKYIEMDFDGLKGAIVRMLGGEDIKVKIRTFQNDILYDAKRIPYSRKEVNLCLRRVDYDSFKNRYLVGRSGC